MAVMTPQPEVTPDKHRIPIPVQPTAPTPEKPETPGYTPPDYQGIGVGPGFGVGGQNINQNNDVNSTVTGNNNTVTNTQDNSINGFGAAARSKYLRDKYVADVSRFARA